MDLGDSNGYLGWLYLDTGMRVPRLKHPPSHLVLAYLTPLVTTPD